MITEGLKVQFIGEDGSLSKTLGDLQGQLKRFQTALKDATNVDSFNRIQRAIDATKGRLEVLNKAASGSGFSKLKTGSNEATQSMLNLSRVAQDMPYGFMGIANNLNPLLESFQRLKATTGSTGGALKALGSSLMGAGGLGLALGVGSSLLVTFGDRLFGVGQNAERVKKEIEALTNALEYLSSENKRIGDNLNQDSRIRIANLRAEGATEQTIFEATNDELLKKRELLRNLQSDLSRTSAKIQSTKGFDLDLFNERLTTGQPLEGQYQKFRVVQDQQLKAEKDYYENEANIQILAAQNRERIRKDEEKRLKDHLSNLEDIQNNFFDKYFKANPKNSEKARQTAEMFAVATEFALANQEIFVGLDKILKADTKASAVSIAEQWWNDFQAGTVRFKMQPIEIPNTATFEKKGTKMDPVNIIPMAEAQKEIINQMENFKQLGGTIGGAIGKGFDVEFIRLFTQTFEKAKTEGKSGQDLQNIMNGMGLAANASAQGITGISDALGQLTGDILTGGEAMENFGDNLKNVFKGVAVQLAKTIALAAILSAISGGKAKGGMNFSAALGKVMGMGGSASPGITGFGSMSALPPAMRMQRPQNYSNISAAASPNVNVSVSLQARGDQLIAVVNKAMRNQNQSF